jgi:hypothetical protein
MATPPDEIVTTVPTIQKSTTSSSLGGPGHFEFVGERRGIPWGLLRTELQFTTIPAAIWLPACNTPRKEKAPHEGVQLVTLQAPAISNRHGHAIAGFQPRLRPIAVSECGPPATPL